MLFRFSSIVHNSCGNGGKKNPHSCSNCGKSFSKKCDAERHTKTIAACRNARAKEYIPRKAPICIDIFSKKIVLAKKRKTLAATDSSSSSSKKPYYLSQHST